MNKNGFFNELDLIGAISEVHFARKSHILADWLADNVIRGFVRSKRSNKAGKILQQP
ncbi:MAG: hypothetical protein CM15mP120_13300 [Pseudomonadota bacterium]|nr:MAG: hypothetical protein CM15mP120_13300 [Pseudomonadota bacterium]